MGELKGFMLKVGIDVCMYGCVVGYSDSGAFEGYIQDLLLLGYLQF